MGMENSHHQGLTGSQTKVNNAYIIGISLNFIFVVIEATVGLVVNSLSLLSDAGHNLADVVALALSLLAFRLMKIRSNEKYTYGYRKTSILVALLNTMFLLVSIGAIMYEAVHRIFNPNPTSGSTIAIVAAVGIVINSVTALMFLSNKDKDINIKSAYLHLMNDALISAGIVAGGIIIYFTNWFWIDSTISIVVVIVILISAWKLLRSSLRLSLDGVPGYISMEDIIATATGIEGVKGIHHIHIWAISTTENALTAHLVMQPYTNSEDEQRIKNDLKHQLEIKNIHHVTLETEKGDIDCETITC
ncbi:MAG: cation transporter [Bacteroidales bacterium]|nr:cation transporter [Bacteroidales bacterium]